MAIVQITEVKRVPRRVDKVQRYFQLMLNRLLFGVFRYEEGKDTIGNPIQDYLKRLKGEVKEYENTGNLEHLVNVSNYALLEFYNSLHPNQHFKIGDSEGKKVLKE